MDQKPISPANQKEWRAWLQENHDKEQSVWVIYYKVKSGKATMSWSDAVDEALCFGWIDSTRRSVDEERFMQFFCRRKPKSVWSKINKEKVERLTSEGLMTPAGQASIDKAKANGSWNILDEVETLTIPEDLQQAFKAERGSEEYFSGLSKSVKKVFLYRLMAAKRPETRAKRIEEILEQFRMQNS